MEKPFKQKLFNSYLPLFLSLVLIIVAGFGYFRLAHKNPQKDSQILGQNTTANLQADSNNLNPLENSNQTLPKPSAQADLPAMTSPPASQAGLPSHSEATAGDPLVKGGFKVLGGSGGGGGGSVSYDNATYGGCGPTGESASCDTDIQLTFSHTTGSGSNRAIVVGCTVAQGSGDVEPNISSVTYNGVNLSLLAKRDANYDTYLWTLPNGIEPASGTNNVVVTKASASSGVIACVALTVSGVDQTTTWTASDATGAGSGTTASGTLSSNSSGDLVVIAECNGTSIGNPTGAITRRAFHDNNFFACASFGMGTAAGGTTALSWNNNGNDNWQMLGAAFKAITVGGNVKFR